MSYVINQRGNRFLGDTEKMMFHDLAYEVEGHDGCNVDWILEEDNAVGFFPDKGEQAKTEGFKPCPKCMG